MSYCVIPKKIGVITTTVLCKIKYRRHRYDKSVIVGKSYKDCCLFCCISSLFFFSFGAPEYILYSQFIFIHVTIRGTIAHLQKVKALQITNDHGMHEWYKNKASSLFCQIFHKVIDVSHTACFVFNFVSPAEA